MKSPSFKELTTAGTHRIRVILISKGTPQHYLQLRSNSRTTRFNRLISTTMNKGAILVMFCTRKEMPSHPMTEYSFCYRGHWLPCHLQDDNLGDTMTLRNWPADQCVGTSFFFFFWISCSVWLWYSIERELDAAL